MNKKNNESTEALVRIPIMIVSGIILWIWFYLILVFVLINFFYVLFSGKRLKEVAEFSEIWNTQIYIFSRYITFVTNERPFPFEKLKKNISKFK